MHRELVIRRALPTAVAGALLAVLLAAVPASAATFYMQRNFVLVALNNSAWSVANGVRAPDCTGVGPSRRDAAFQKTYASYRCTVINTDGSAPRGEILVSPTGPEAVRVVRTVSGDSPPDRPIANIPRGKGRIRSSDVAALLKKSAWARTHAYLSAVCYGVGPFDAQTGIDIAGAYFGAFVCRTTVGGGARSNVLLVATSGRRSVRVARTLV
jgi:hypothetical protein